MSDPAGAGAAAARSAAQQFGGAADLPVSLHRQVLVDLISRNQVVIVCGETGSGKSTQIPQFLQQEGLANANSKVAVAEPRRLAACSLAARVAQETQVELGAEVGYAVRFDNRSSPQTIIKYLTNGMLIREALADPLLKDYGALLIDEAHERSVETDIMLGLVLQILTERPELKVIVCSATLDSEKLSRYFGGAPVYEVPGRRYPVTKLYTANTDHLGLKDLAAQTIEQIHIQEPLNGDILVFLPGQSDIEALETSLAERSLELGSAVPELIIVPVFASMSNEAQTRIFRKTPQNCRKVVLATNIAETSLTIPGIKYVIDSGLVKQQSHDARSALDSLETVNISKSSAEQRAGRAGRMGPGTCYRLYSKEKYARLDEQTTPEILRSNLAQVLLLLLSSGIGNLLSFPWVDAPSTDAIVAAFQILYALGAVNQDAQLTKLGRLMAEFPVDPKLARSLVASVQYDCSSEIAIIAAMLGEAGSVFVTSSKKTASTAAAAAETAHAQLKDERGDQITLLNIFEQWERARYSKAWCHANYINYRALSKAKYVRDQLIGLTTRLKPLINKLPFSNSGSDETRLDRVIRTLMHGYFLHSARLSKNNMEYVGYNLGTPASIHPSSVLWGEQPPPNFIVYSELVVTSKAYMRGCLKTSPAILGEVASHFYFQNIQPQ